MYVQRMAWVGSVVVVLGVGLLVFRTLRSDSTAPAGMGDGRAQASAQSSNKRNITAKPPLKNPKEQSMSPSLIRKAQEQLKQRGYWTGEIDGKWSDQLYYVLRKFQAEQGLTTSGNLDARTRYALDI